MLNGQLRQQLQRVETRYRDKDKSKPRYANPSEQSFFSGSLLSYLLGLGSGQIHRQTNQEWRQHHYPHHLSNDGSVGSGWADCCACGHYLRNLMDGRANKHTVSKISSIEQLPMQI